MCSNHTTATNYGGCRQAVKTKGCDPFIRGFDSHQSPQYAIVAQLVEQRTENPCVVGSIPTFGTNAPLVQLDQNATLRTLRSEVRILQGVPIKDIQKIIPSKYYYA